MTDLRLDAALLRDLEGFALGVASEAALLIAERAEAGVSATKSSPTDVVTEMDRRAQALIEERIAAYRPQDAFFGEEDGNRAGSSGITWVVDPIDGTVNYVYDIPAYAVSVAAVVGDPRTPGAWTPVAGAVVNPVSGERFWARAGGGASRQRGRLGATRIGVSTQRDLSLALIGTGFGYEPATRAWQARVLAPLLPRVRDIRRFGSAALDLCHVADGSLDGYYERGLNPWDMAAGSLIVTEAGGTVSGLDGAPASRDLVIAGGACANDLNLLLQAIHEKVGPHPAP
ncbi:MAG: inositol monophosphatase [Tetrasphaera jenkinsii]|jgi:myo-inositol-1(or 4)-monophosphatase|nr:inositol monophosphatase [Tetrasphaera jenkinsii]